MGGGEGAVGFTVLTAGFPAGVVEGGVAGSWANDFARGSGPPGAGVCATGGLEVGVVAALAGAVELAGAVAALGWACGRRPLAGAVAVGTSRFGAWTAPAGGGGVFWVPGTGSA
jgi:hypothetical protein